MLSVVFCCVSVALKASDVVRTEVYRVRLPFAFDRPYLDPNYRDVQSRLDSLSALMGRLSPDDVDEIEICGYSSPEGAYARNEYLAEKRLLSLKFFFYTKWREFSNKFVYTKIPETWELLRVLIEEDGHLTGEEKAAALAVIDSDGSLEVRKARMEGLPFYSYIYKNIYSEARGGCAVVVRYREPEPETAAPEPEVIVFEPFPSDSLHVQEQIVPDVAVPEEVIPEEVIPEEVISEEVVSEQPVKRPLNFGAPVIGVKTNLLTDIAAVPGIGIEFGVGKHFSAVANFQGAWWSSEKRNFFWQAITGDVAVRWWLKEHFTGHHVGIYGQAVTFDFELGQRGYQLNRPGYGAGIEYGWAMPLGRKNNGLSLDFEVGVGYISGDILEYEPDCGHYVWQQTTRFRWFGPTKAGVTLIWAPQLGGKGGKR